MEQQLPPPVQQQSAPVRMRQDVQAVRRGQFSLTPTAQYWLMLVHENGEMTFLPYATGQERDMAFQQWQELLAAQKPLSK